MRLSSSSLFRFALGCMLALAGCHRELSTSNVVVAVTPGNATNFSLGSQQCTALVAGSDNQSVAWSVREQAAGGTISVGGLYTAPGTAGTFHVVATSAADTSQSATATVAVNRAVPVLHPPSIRYAPDTLECTTGSACGLSAPGNPGSAITSFTIAPALPTGLGLDAVSGAIVGTPTIASASSSYTITATNPAGSGSATVTIAVLIAPPADLAYAGALSCYQDIPCRLAAPGSSGGAIDSPSNPSCRRDSKSARSLAHQPSSPRRPAPSSPAATRAAAPTSLFRPRRRST